MSASAILVHARTIAKSPPPVQRSLFGLITVVSPSPKALWIEVDVDDCFDVDVLCNAVVTAGEVEVNTIIENNNNRIGSGIINTAVNNSQYDVNDISTIVIGNIVTHIGSSPYFLKINY